MHVGGGAPSGDAAATGRSESVPPTREPGGLGAPREARNTPAGPERLDHHRPLMATIDTADDTHPESSDGLAMALVVLL